MVLKPKIIPRLLRLFWRSLKHAIARLMDNNAIKLDSTDKITVEDKFWNRWFAGEKTMPIKKIIVKPITKKIL